MRFSTRAHVGGISSTANSALGLDFSTIDVSLCIAEGTLGILAKPAQRGDAVVGNVQHLGGERVAALTELTCDDGPNGLRDGVFF